MTGCTLCSSIARPRSNAGSSDAPVRCWRGVELMLTEQGSSEAVRRVRNLEYNAAMRRLKLVVRCIVLATLGVLPACSLSPSDPQTAASPAPGVSRSVSPVSLTLWHSWSGVQLEALNSVARAYEQANPDVRISLQSRPRVDIIRSYGLSVADGSAPQLLLVLGRYTGELAERQHVAALDNLLDDAALRDMLPQATDSGRVAGQLYGIPIAFDTQVLFYDRRRVAAPPTTLDEVRALNTAQRAEPPESRPWSLAYHLSLETTLPYLGAFGGAVLDQQRQPIFASQGRAATLDWLDWLRSLQADEHVLASPDFSAVDAAVQQNRVLSVIDWSHRRASYERLWQGQVGVAPLPVLSADSPPQPLIMPELISINTVISPEQRGAALNFMRFLIARPAQETLWTRGRLLPSNQSVELPIEAQPFREAALQSQPLPSEVTATTVWRPFNDMLRSVLFNTATTTEALDAARVSLERQQP